MRDEIWVALRAILMVGGGFLAGKGYVTNEQLTSILSNIEVLIPALTALGGAAWAMWVRFNTRAVPAATAARTDVPTVSAATGAHETGQSKT